MEHIRAFLRLKKLTLGWFAEQIGLSRNTVKKWAQVPPEHVLTVEALTGVSRYIQRPDIFGAPPPAADQAGEAAA